MIQSQMEAINQPIGQLLLAKQKITPADLERALSFQNQYGGRLGSVLIRMGAISEDALLPLLAAQTGYTLLHAADIPDHSLFVNTILSSGLTPDWFTDQKVAAWEGQDGIIHALARDPLNSNIQEILSAAFSSHDLQWHFLRTPDLEKLLDLLQQSPSSMIQDEVAHLRELAEEAPVIELVNNILSLALDENASDVHIEPEERTFQVRYRIDGVLQTRFNQPRERFDAIASRIKLISGMDIAERRLPQDGRISMRASGIEMDIRISAVPGVHGESIVLRLLPKERADLKLDRLGMEADHLSELQRWVSEPHGIILVTGPTGSGKSTTLYAALDAANDHQHKIITVEDPVEYKMAGITQIQTHSEIGYDFSRALRAILRQDPDIIMIGEIRDRETAEIAIQSALTGHMVLSTLHTNDAISAFARMLDMGLEPFLVASSVRAVQAQRLVRKLCPACSIPTQPPSTAKEAIAAIQNKFPALLPAAPDWRNAVGCPECNGSGYRGRIGIYEFVTVTPELQNAIMRRASSAEMLAATSNTRNLREDGLIKAWKGLTTIEEIFRITGIGNSDG